MEPGAACTSCGAALPAGSRFCHGCGAPRPLSGESLVGRVIADRYRVLSELGQGGMGTVYKVEHVHIGKLMAMKVLAGDLAGDTGMFRRFKREAKAISRLSHPNTVQIFDFGQSDKLAYLVMEYLPGRDFAAVIADDAPLSFARVANICAQVAASVGEAHERGIIHRDIKPENVRIVQNAGRRDIVKVLDFGIAKLRDTEEAGPSTLTGHLLGTPYYMAPEQIRGEPYDQRVDIYALGAMMYKALSGVPPFVADTPMGVLGQHLTAVLVPVRVRSQRLDLPEAADAIIARAMQKSPQHRYPRMEDLRTDLLAYLGEVGASDGGEEPPARLRPIETTHHEDFTWNGLATRGDVDRYERRISRKSWLASALFALVVSVLSVVGYQAYRERPGRVRRVEVEPNDEPRNANRLTPGEPMTGMLGKRQSVSQGDADVYEFDVPLGETRVASVVVTALPNMDVLLDLVRKGESTPLLVADTGRFAEPEVIPNFGVRGGRYQVRVREQWEGDRLPTENVSDTYTITVRFEAQAPGDETEPNDTFETAEQVAQPEQRQGYLGWSGDHDVCCLARELLPARVSVGQVGGLNLVLKVVERTSDASRVVDEHGVGGGESVDIAGPASGPVCVELSVRPDSEAARGDAGQRYMLRVLRL